MERRATGECRSMVAMVQLPQKKLKELESQLNQVFSLPLDTPCHQQRFSQDIQQRFLFLNNLLSAEVASRPRKPYHLQHIAQRLLQLEAAFQEWDSFQTSAPGHVEKGSTCSCTESCLNDDGEAAQGSSELMSLADLEQVAEVSTELSLIGQDLEGFDDQDRAEHVPVPVENHKTTSTRVVESEAEKKEEEDRVWVAGAERSMIREEVESNGNAVWLGKYCLGTLAIGVVLGMVLMAFFMVGFSGCSHCHDSDYTFSLSPT